MTLPHILIALTAWTAASCICAAFIASMIQSADAGNVRADTQSHKGAMQHD